MNIRHGDVLQLDVFAMYSTTLFPVQKVVRSVMQKYSIVVRAPPIAVFRQCFKNERDISCSAVL